MRLAMRNDRPLSRLSCWLAEHPLLGGMTYFAVLALGTALGRLVLGLPWNGIEITIFLLFDLWSSWLVIGTAQDRARRANH